MLISSLSVSYWALVAARFAKFLMLRAMFLYILQNATQIPQIIPEKIVLRDF